jgi:hypothetical protein
MPLLLPLTLTLPFGSDAPHLYGASDASQRLARESRASGKRFAAPLMSELKLRPPKKRAAFLIDNFKKTRAIRNHIQTKQNNHHDQILIDTFVDPLPRQLIPATTGTSPTTDPSRGESSRCTQGHSHQNFWSAAGRSHVLPPLLTKTPTPPKRSSRGSATASAPQRQAPAVTSTICAARAAPQKRWQSHRTPKVLGGSIGILRGAPAANFHFLFSLFHFLCGARGSEIVRSPV